MVRDRHNAVLTVRDVRAHESGLYRCNFFRDDDDDDDDDDDGDTDDDDHDHHDHHQCMKV